MAKVLLPVPGGNSPLRAENWSLRWSRQEMWTLLCRSTASIVASWGRRDKLFEYVLTNTEHSLSELLPDCRHELAYSLRPRQHDLTLSRGSHHLSDCNFVVRQHFKDCYWSLVTTIKKFISPRPAAKHTSSSAMAERPRELGDFKKARVNGGTNNHSLMDSHKCLRCRWQTRIIW